MSKQPPSALPNHIKMYSQLAPSSFLRPAEWAPHNMTIMAWPDRRNPSYFEEPRSLLRDATSEISNLAEAIANHEPVQLLVSHERERDARDRFSKQDTTYNVSIQVVPGDQLDLWTRDFAPTFTYGLDEEQQHDEDTCEGSNTSDLYGIDFHFNGWGGRYPARTTSQVAKNVVESMQQHHVGYINSSLVLEGGAIEVDGEGTMMATESSILNPNRNPGKTLDDIEKELKHLLGVSKIIWIPGLRDLDVTDSHIDGLARFVRPGMVLLSRPWAVRHPQDSTPDDDVYIQQYKQARDILINYRDARGRMIKVVEVEEGDFSQFDSSLADENEPPCLSYVNYYVCNEAVIIPEFGIPETDEAAKKVIGSLFGGEREVVPVPLRAIPLLGGGIHCSTQEVPRLED